MNHTISLSAQQLLALVKASLWQRPADETVFSKEAIDWQKISQLALEQTVGILTFELSHKNITEPTTPLSRDY
ncbi:MAG: hypothetical protein K2I92_06180, partial [Muribaculaceae bacterium]|nr:hypothetical protein [Muribaculaceae bacterium]